MFTEIDTIKLNFNPSSLFLLNFVLGFIMFGIALSLKVQDFRYVLQIKKAFFIGIFSQFFLFPFTTFVLTLLLEPIPSMALGMILVASCPGGNISNFITFLAKGNVALSVSMTAISTILAIILTPLNFSIWSSLNPNTTNLLKALNLNPFSMILDIFLIIGIPLSLGLIISHKFPKFANRFTNFIKYFSIAFFTFFVLAALYINFDYFIKYIKYIFFLVFLQNFFAFLSGYVSSKIFQVAEKDLRAITIEVGIQNSGLGLILIFNFFDGLGGMALIAAWWGIWHILAGLTLAFYWSYQK
ncbi:MAG: bile acid:sodium symporter family protein [Leptonema sp. (in: bacteria)]